MKKLVSLAMAFILAVSAAVILAGCLRSESDGIDHGKEVVDEFFYYFKNKDYEACLNCFEKSDSADLSKLEDYTRIFDAISDNFDYRVLSSKPYGDKFKVEVEVTTVDFAAVANDMKDDVIDDIANFLKSDYSVGDYVDKIADSIRAHSDETISNKVKVVVKKSGDEWKLEGGVNFTGFFADGLTDLFGGIDLF